MNASRQRLGRSEVAILVAVAVVLAVVALAQAGALPGRAAAVARQDTPPAQPELLDTTLVYVNGSGSVRVPPDTASVVIGVDIERPTLAEAQSEATTQAAAIIAAIETAGVAAADIRTTAFSVRIVRERERDPERAAREERSDQPRAIKGFQVSNAVAVTVRDLDSLGRVLDDAIAAGANDVRNIAFFLDDPADAAGQARTLAMADARIKTGGLATAAGMAVSRVVSISETSSPRPAPVEFAAAGSREAAIADASGGEVPIAIGSDEIAVEVQVTYKLE